MSWLVHTVQALCWDSAGVSTKGLQASQHEHFSHETLLASKNPPRKRGTTTGVMWVISPDVLEDLLGLRKSGAGEKLPGDNPCLPELEKGKIYDNAFDMSNVR